MYKLFFFIFILFHNQDVISQDDYKIYHKMILESNNLSKDSSIMVMEKAFSIATPFPEDLITLAFRYYSNGNFKKAKKVFYQSISVGNQIEPDIKKLKDTTFYFEYNHSYINEDNNSEFNVFINSIYKNKKNKIKKLRNEFLKKTNTKDNYIYEVLLHNESYFQSLRFHVFKINPFDTLIYDIVSKYGNTPNSYFMLKLLKEKSFPKRRNCMRFNGQTITILLNHAISGFLSKDDALEFIELLWGLVLQGELTPLEYANAYDHYVHWYISEDKGLFGTKVYLNDLGEFIVQDLLIPNEVNLIRQKYLIECIELFCERRNWKLPSNYGK
jgi:hypothetical protein